MSALEAKNLGVAIGGTWLVRGVDLRVAPGAVIALTGANGTGKSTILRALAALWPASEGSVAWDARDLRELRRREIAAHITHVPQDTRLDFAFTVRETVRMGRYAHRGRFERETARDRDAAEQAMRQTDIEYLADRPANELSGGERQRVLIARSLATEADVLLLDEPTANLDIDHSLDVLELCRKLAALGKAVVIATHDLNAVIRYATHAVLLECGQIVAQGEPGAVLTRDNLGRAFGVRAETLSAIDGTPVFLFHKS